MTSRTTTEHPPSEWPDPHGAAGTPTDELAVAQQRIVNLEEALRTSRVIGTAVGIIVERRKVSADTAFSLLVAMSRTRNRRLYDVAADLVETGALTDDPA